MAALVLAVVSTLAMVLSIGMFGTGTAEAMMARREMSNGIYWTKLPGDHGIAPGEYRVELGASAGHYQYVSVYRDTDIDNNQSTNYTINPGKSVMVTVPVGSAVKIAYTDSTMWYASKEYNNYGLMNAGSPVTRSGNTTYSVGASGIAVGQYQVNLAQGEAKQTVEVLASDGSEIHSYHVGWYADDDTQIVTVPSNASTIRLSYPDKTVWRTLTKRPSYERVKDVNSSTPHQAEILALMKSGVSAGWEQADGSTVFRPAAAVQRQDMAAFLYRLAGSPSYTPSAADKAKFSDVRDGTPQAKAVWWLASTGISTGYSNGTFGVGAPVYRQDMAAFLHRYAAKFGGPSASGSDKSFTDVNASTSHAEDIQWLAKAGISTGYSDGSFGVGKLVVRQDMAAFLMRMKK
ncbi:S-layer homology domain-containing protein [Bifidobacterium miconisargentati]|uniref:S-layer homology domain-containing protein n=1 Tax=Bifidobacterium miconisargentati TaxID=2834437 RepID=UPI001BDCE397|nr:S-layer homology domain-containing protein [Bifidobacterium miconisargentati]MBW3091307.1 S-layer homology domain-containing protein [Bifidobacterium miconisargentati]